MEYLFIQMVWGFWKKPSEQKQLFLNDHMGFLKDLNIFIFRKLAAYLISHRNMMVIHERHRLELWQPCRAVSIVLFAKLQNCHCMFSEEIHGQQIKHFPQFWAISLSLCSLFWSCMRSFVCAQTTPATITVKILGVGVFQLTHNHKGSK